MCLSVRFNIGICERTAKVATVVPTGESFNVHVGQAEERTKVVVIGSIKSKLLKLLPDFAFIFGVLSVFPPFPAGVICDLFFVDHG